MVPKVLVPCLEEGTDGDALPPTFSIETRGGELGPYLSQHPWEGKMKPRMAAALQHLQGTLGATNIGLIGFCWGGWVLSHVASDADTFSPVIKCGVVPHPSIGLENMIFGGDVAALVQKVKVPCLWLPAGNDGAEYDAPDGAWFKVLHDNHPTSHSIRFPAMQHGWVPRGAANDAAVSAAAGEAVQHTIDFLSKHMA